MNAMNFEGRPGIRERVEALADAVDVELDADRRFFKRRKNRKYRIRRSFPAEAEATLLMLNTPPLPMDRALFTAVREVKPGARLRLFFVALRSFETDVPDEAAEQVFNVLSRGNAKVDEIARVIMEKHP